MAKLPISAAAATHIAAATPREAQAVARSRAKRVSG
jgi:hypothetical protein